MISYLYISNTSIYTNAVLLRGQTIISFHDFCFLHVTGEKPFYKYADPPLTNCAIKVSEEMGPKILQAVQKRLNYA